jgi:alkanesulfonate monooxygenase SsuD/methylene tetrahydromethanopterin reductase-like flavin-dependent oxidoreductase (luciferase family)
VSTRNEPLILSAAIAGSGHHPGAAVRSPQALDVAHFRHLVQTAERGLLDFVFLHDEPALPDTAVTGRLDALSVINRPKQARGLCAYLRLVVHSCPAFSSAMNGA